MNPDGNVRPDHQLEMAEQRRDLQRLNELATAGQAEADDEDVIDLREYWNVLLRRKGTVFTVMAVAVVAALLVTFLSTPIFRAEALIQIDREEGKFWSTRTLQRANRSSPRTFIRPSTSFCRAEVWRDGS